MRKAGKENEKAVEIQIQNRRRDDSIDNRIVRLSEVRRSLDATLRAQQESHIANQQEEHFWSSMAKFNDERIRVTNEITELEAEIEIISNDPFYLEAKNPWL